MVVDKEVDGTWKSYKVALRGIRNYIMGSGDSDTDMYKITLDPNGGTIEGSSEARTIELSAGPLGDRLPIPTPQPSSEGFAGLRFEGWWTDPEGGTKITGERIVPESGNITLYAHWIGVIRYRVENHYDDNVVTIDDNHVASGFKGQVSTGKYCAIKTLDKFDFTGKFKIYMKAKRGDGGTRQDIFAANEEDGGANIFMDFGIKESAPQWEIARYNDGMVTSAYPPRTHISVGDKFTLRVVRNDENRILCYSQLNDSGEWTLDYEGEGNGYLAPGTFYIGIDHDSLSEFFTGEIYLDECYLVQYKPNAGNPLGKYILVPSET